MKITSKILSIPPYISASWENIASLHMEKGNILVVTLHNGTDLSVPGLDEESLKRVFQAHSQYLDENGQEESDSNQFGFGMPMDMGNLENMQSMMQHNPEQANSPPIPSEVLEKISAVSKALGVDMSEQTMPVAEPHCNCMYCQIARAMNGEATYSEPQIEEEVSDDELKFKEWDIKQVDKVLYDVSNPIDHDEHYQVFLGEPIGCTCGRKDCEHIQAVLKS